jgi:hypothetical protein
MIMALHGFTWLSNKSFFSFVAGWMFWKQLTVFLDSLGFIFQAQKAGHCGPTDLCSLPNYLYIIHLLTDKMISNIYHEKLQKTKAKAKKHTTAILWRCSPGTHSPVFAARLQAGPAGFRQQFTHLNILHSEG